jgi:hypothetical protein
MHIEGGVTLAVKSLFSRFEQVCSLLIQILFGSNVYISDTGSILNDVTSKGETGYDIGNEYLPSESVTKLKTIKPVLSSIISIEISFANDPSGNVNLPVTLSVAFLAL